MQELLKNTAIGGRFRRALDDILARVFVSAPASLAVAYSGGLDSSVLLRLTAGYAACRGMFLLALHVHHGLSANADAWLAHCREEAARLGVTFDFRKVTVDAEGAGPEAAARAARYQALGEMCRMHRAPLLLLAHHLDDQVETILLQLLRGAGLNGLSGMEGVGTMPALIGDASTLVARPLLPFTRAQLAALADQAGITHVEDESNRNLHHPRNALRHQVLPLIESYFPAYRECLARTARHAQSAQRLLDALAARDLADVREDGALVIDRLRRLEPDRIASLLRYWLAQNGLRPPSAAWLEEAQAQLFDARPDAQVCVMLDGAQLRRYQGRILVTRSRRLEKVDPIGFRWNGESCRAFPGWGGTLFFDWVEGGADPDWARAQALRIQHRTGGERLKLMAKRPSKTLKDWYQEKGVPPWEREKLPLVYAGEALWFAAGIGQDCRFPASKEGLRLRWEADS